MANRRKEYVLEAPDTYMCDVLSYLNELGAWFEGLEKQGGRSRLRFTAPEAGMQQFQEWLKHATRTTNEPGRKLDRNLH